MQKKGTIKDRNGMDLTKAEDIKRWQEHTELYQKKALMTQITMMVWSFTWNQTSWNVKSSEASVQWLGLCAFTTEGPGLIPGWETKDLTSHVAWPVVSLDDRHQRRSIWDSSWLLCMHERLSFHKELFLTFNSGIKRNRLKILNLGVLWLTKWEVFCCGVLMLRMWDEDVAHVQISPDVPWLYLGSTCIEVVFLVSDDKFKFCLRIL